VIVPYADGKTLITDLFGLKPEFPDFYQKLRTLQRQAQKYSVNVFPHVWQKLSEAGAITEVKDTGIYTIEDQYYSDEYGLSVQADGKMDFYGF
jgi:CRISPR-associated endonuclease/helicase Cas3